MKPLYTFFFICFTTYFSSAQCLEDRHSPFQHQGWQSCMTSVGPVDRGEKHWIAYDFGERYVIDSLYFWNHNVWGETGMGVKEFMIDYSTDQVNWTAIGPFTIDKAPGSWKYEGTAGPLLGNIEARYMLFTVMSTWDASASCAGLGEVKFNLGLSTDIEEVEPELAWNISPNPATDQITIQLPEGLAVTQLSLYSAVGVLVKQLNVPVKSAIGFVN